MLRVPEVKISIEEKEQDVKREIAKKLKVSEGEIISYEIFKESIDARKKDMIYFTYTVDVEVKNEEKVLNRLKKTNIGPKPNVEYAFPTPGEEKLAHPPVVVGSGPAGIFAGLVLAEMGYRPIVLERGKKVEERTQDVEQFWEGKGFHPESNVQFGEGGAGTFSDGKLTTQIKNIRCRKILEEMVEAGAPKEIIYKSKPHVGTDILQSVVKNIRNKIITLGGQVLFESKVTDLIIEEEKVVGVVVNGKEKIQTEAVILALGHSARDTFEMIYNRQVAIVQKPFAIGVRIEHPQTLINTTQYGNFAEHPRLGAADYKLAYHCKNGRSTYTFCMCPGGTVVAAASEEGGVVTNGMSEYARDKENANSALLVGIGPEDFESDHPLAGMFYQRKWEQKAFELGGSNYHAPAQLVKDFLADRPSKDIGSVKPSYTPGVTLTDLRECLPGYVIETMKEGILGLNAQLKGFALEDAVMTGVETRSSSPIRILRNEGCESNIKGLYPAGEGAGYAGGIVSAAVDGIKVAEEIMKKYKPN